MTKNTSYQKFSKFHFLYILSKRVGEFKLIFTNTLLLYLYVFFFPFTLYNISVWLNLIP